MKALPLLFTFRDVIVGNGFVARVVADGRVLLTEEDDGDVWMYGVSPGGIAGGGQGRERAFREFKVSYLSVLFDTAATAESFDAFKDEVEKFFNEQNEPTAHQWDDALAEVRRTQLPVVPGLPVVKAETRPPRIEVSLIETARATVNAFDEIAEAA